MRDANSDGERPDIDRRSLLKGAGVAAMAGSVPVFPTSTGRASDGLLDGPTGVHVSFGTNPKRQARVGWTGDEILGGHVEYGEDFSKTADADKTVVPGEGLYAYTAELTGLDPDTSYEYRVVHGDTTSETFSFRTAPPDSETSLRVTAVGDHGIADPDNEFQRADDDNPVRVLDRAASFDPDFHLGVGDIAYANGYPFTWDEYFESFEEFYASNQFLTVPGNHEKEPGQGFVQYDARLNELMPFDDPGLPNLTSKQRWYDFQYGNTLFVGLNTSADACGDYARGEEFIPLQDTRCRTEASYFYNERQREYVEETLKEADADDSVKWIVVYMHSGFWTDGDHDARQDLRDLWGPYFDEYDVDLVLAGHNHSYERSKPIRGEAVAETGTTYVVNGTGGSGHYGFQHNEPPEWTAFRDSDHYGAVQLDVTDERIRGEYVAIDGTVVDEFTIVKEDGEPTQPNPGDAEAESLSVSGQRRDDGSAFDSGETNRVRLTASAEESVRLRDEIPEEWNVASGGDSAPDMVDTTDAPEGRKYVYFDVDPRTSPDVVYYAEAPDETGTYTFGPFEAREENGTGWVEVAGTASDENVVGLL
ncbi:purple acid phosphatase family protein [Halorussus halophilus]|uniref:purple acid phosphatase family protein n=1 Tax=Halorussus halophilus TaxID=2650975 RepID=UPI0013011287|nr:metallophosphoesterase family protein [Halorussus halophilus]